MTFLNRSCRYGVSLSNTVFRLSLTQIFITTLWAAEMQLCSSSCLTAETCHTASTTRRFQTIHPLVFYVWSEVTLESSDVCSCIPAQVVLSYEQGNRESSWRFVWWNAAFHLSLWQIIKLMLPALWETSGPQTMFNKHPANLDRCLVIVNGPRQVGLAIAVTHTTARASELFPCWQY